MAVTPDGRRAVSASTDRTLRVWDLETGESLRTLGGLLRRVLSVAVTPDGRRVVSASRDQAIRVWDLKTGKLVASLSVDHSVEAVAITPGGAVIIVGDEGGIVHFLRLEGLE